VKLKEVLITDINATLWWVEEIHRVVVCKKKQFKLWQKSRKSEVGKMCVKKWKER